MLKVNFWGTTFTPPGQLLQGYLILEGGTIKARPDPSDPKNKILFQSVMSDLLPMEKKMIKENPAKWLRSLPAKYSGAMLRAELVESQDRKDASSVSLSTKDLKDESLEHDMSDGVRVWAIDESDSLKEMQLSKLNYEERIENWTCNNVSVLVPEDSGLLVIGRQVKTTFGGIIDLLCMNGDGDLVIVELKRGQTPRDVTAQALDYASWVQDLTLQQVEGIASEYLGKPLKDAFEDTFPEGYPEVINAQHSIKIVASQIDDSTERIIRYLSGKGIAINFVRFHLFKSADGKEHLVRTFVVPPGQAEENSRKGAGTKRTSPRRTLQDKVNDESLDEAEREFLRQRLSDPKQKLNRPRTALVYSVSGTRRFMVWAKESCVHVGQRGRFENDEKFWRDHLSAPNVEFRKKGKKLAFVLSTGEDYKFFQDTMEQEIARLHWSSAEADGDEGEENEDEER